MFMASSKILLKPLQHDILQINKGWKKAYNPWTNIKEDELVGKDQKLRSLI